MLKQFHINPVKEHAQLLSFISGTRSGVEAIIVALLERPDFVEVLCSKEVVDCGINMTSHDSYKHITCINLGAGF